MQEKTWNVKGKPTKSPIQINLGCLQIANHSNSYLTTFWNWERWHQPYDFFCNFKQLTKGYMSNSYIEITREFLHPTPSQLLPQGSAPVQLEGPYQLSLRDFKAAAVQNMNQFFSTRTLNLPYQEKNRKNLKFPQDYWFSIISGLPVTCVIKYLCAQVKKPLIEKNKSNLQSTGLVHAAIARTWIKTTRKKRRICGIVEKLSYMWSTSQIKIKKRNLTSNPFPSSAYQWLVQLYDTFTSKGVEQGIVPFSQLTL